MPYRPGQTEWSRVSIEIRLTPEEKIAVIALARYEQMTVSELVRVALEQYRATLIKSGKKPPRK